MRWKSPLVLTALAALALGSWLFAVRPWATHGVELLNVSYDPTRELWQELNELFIAKTKRETGQDLTINQSHGGSGAQARAVIDGLEADVVTLALGSDTDALRRHGLLADDWQKRLPNHSLPYYSTIVFVVRKGNPEKVRDWPDLARSGIGVITPNPKTSGNGKLSFLAAWGSVLRRGGSVEDARAFVAKLYRNVPKLDTGARGSTITFARQQLGDVHLTWENEAHLEVAEAKGELEIVYPPVSIRTEPFVAVVDGNVDRKGTREVAEAYLRFVYSDEAQEVLARHYYRPISEGVFKKYADRFPKLDLFSINVIARDWNDAQERFFAEGGIFDQIQKKR